ncbi:HIT domain-containing protein [Candidatus Woesearchaeota archaeon]|nr:HIT domain-containing protein [Candidatus Woesearchaeota archaeon]
MAEQPQLSPEQLKALQERIKQMSPEELKEFQKKQCVFCQIVAGKVQSKKIYDDDKVLAILDINPANPGHVLLVTKEHYAIMPQIPDDEVAHVFMAAKSLSNSMLKSIDAQGTNIIVANGIAAGQRAQHFMVHIIPRKENDGINFVLPQKEMPQNEIEAVGNKLIAALVGAAEEEKPVIPAKIPEPKREEPKKESKKSEAETKQETRSSINLDDISKMLGVK